MLFIKQHDIFTYYTHIRKV